ncbi:MAG: sigma 54-interacting transcriptional regulator [Spirochaetales bacterium]|nr:sigma 54-interacting transcriptional regulator [Spirochaetales bacterium]
MNEYDFFKKAVILLCKNLEIENSLYDCLRFFHTLMPADIIFLQIYDPGFSAMRTIAQANLEKGEAMDLLTPLSGEAQASMERAAHSDFPSAFILNDPDNYPISKEMLSFHKVKASSLIILSLSAHKKPLGSLVLISESEERFTDDHKNLIALLMEPFVIAMSNTLKHREILALKEILADDNRFLKHELNLLSGDTIVGANFGLKHVMEHVRQVSIRDTPVLLLGETGVGKDLIAKAIHYSSERRNGPFITVNCGAIPETLIDSELFGHEKGAFTGALAQRRGRFERAQDGTIFLDEIGELPLNIQVRLLRVLQNKEFERVGGSAQISLNVRIVAATNQNLEKLIEEKKFREDLWFRLHVFPIQVPPLRHRKEDIPAFVQHFMAKKTKQLKLSGIPELAPGAISRLMNYDWPGNVRELENIIERALIVHDDQPLSFETLITGKTKENSLQPNPENPVTLDDVLKHHITKIVAQTKGKIHGPGGAAELLGINASTLRHKMNKLGIKYGKQIKT